MAMNSKAQAQQGGKPTIVHICRDLEYRGGVEVVLFEFLSHNKEFNHVLIATEGRSGDRARRLMALGVDVFYVTGSFFSKMRKINEIVGKLDRPVLHCHLFRPEILGVFVRGCRKKVTTKYCTYASDSQVGKGLPGHLRRFADNCFFTYLVTLLFQDIIVITNELERKWRWIPRRIHHIPVSTIREYAPCPPSRILTADMKLLVATRMVKEKGHALLVEALREIKFSKLFLLGDGPLRGEVCASLMDAGIENVEFLGAVPRKELFALMKQSDVMLLTSRTEGLPLLIQEAMSLGLPVVATDVGGNGQLIDDAVGRLVRKADAASFSEAVNSLIGCDVGKMGAIAIERCRENFCLSSTIKSINDVYKSDAPGHV